MNQEPMFDLEEKYEALEAYASDLIVAIENAMIEHEKFGFQRLDTWDELFERFQELLEVASVEE